MISIKLVSAFAAVLALSMAPVGRGVEHQVTVGGPGILAYDPQFLVSYSTVRTEEKPLTSTVIECFCGRYGSLHVRAKEPHHHSIDLRKSM